MTKKSDKKVKLHREKILKLQKQLSGARQQNDEPADIERLEREIAGLRAEIERLLKEDH